MTATSPSTPRSPRQRCKAVFIDNNEIVHPADERIAPAKEHFKEIGGLALRELSAMQILLRRP